MVLVCTGRLIESQEGRLAFGVYPYGKQCVRIPDSLLRGPVSNDILSKVEPLDSNRTATTGTTTYYYHYY